MSPFALNLEKTQIKSSLVMVEPAINAFGSMVLISKGEDEPGIHEWVAKTRAKMSAEERFRHKLVTIGFHYSILPQQAGTTFETYLSELDATPPSEFRDRLLKAYSEICMTEEAQKEQSRSVDWDEVLSSARNYVEFLRFRFGEELTDEEIETRAYQYVIDPAALKQLVTGHIRWFWRNYLQAEWTRVRPMLEESAKAFNQIDVSDMTRLEIIQFVTGKEYNESKWGDELDNAKNLIFIPNAHLGPYIRHAKIQDDFYIYFGAHLPEGSTLHIPELDRAEIVARLSALADDTRLKILQMIADRGEMRSQEIMEAINLSQPSVSRYLSQLTATGYLQERRESGAKVYILNKDRIEKTFKAVNAFLLGRT
ncbi:MAG: metalloregulator ArsR/SmtB family transcription factor [Anaerolineae bacterium]|nr:metalloregulator ArsR/SmtB family transcription factor [Anaerolineae bacterium]MCI0608192.1 metalloregulator ArsR/SmtB family transcription factor [Anaerolineae bacterium]